MLREGIEQKRLKQRERAHSYGIDIEHILSKLLGLSYGSLEDAKDIQILQVNADTCEQLPFQNIKCGLFYHLALNPTKRNEIKNYLEKYCFVSNMSASDILSFVTEADEIGSYTLGENGVEYLERMIDDFRAIIR